jgi:hypothetical protein
LRRVERRQPLARGAVAERVVAAGVQHHDVHAVAGRLEGVDHAAQVDRLARHVVGARQLGIDRHHVVAEVHLQPVAGVIQHADALLALQAVAHARHRVGHLRERAILQFDHVEAERLERRRHRGGVVGRVGERRGARVGGVADHQRDADVHRRLRRRAGREQRRGHAEVALPK